MSSSQPRRHRAYRLALDPTPDQQAALAQHAGAARWAYNYAHALKLERSTARSRQLDELITLGYSHQQARRLITVKLPNANTIADQWRRDRADPRADAWRGGICPWYRNANTYAFTSGFRDADQAWTNWLSSLSGTRAGPRVGQPRFKRKGRARDSFRLHHNVKKPGIRPDGYRRLRVPNIGSIRLDESNKRMCRALDRGGRVQSVTISRGGSRWYASVLVDEPDITPGRETQVGPSHRQKSNGRIGVDLGVSHLAALSTGETIDNPRHLHRARKRLTRVQRELSRRQGPDKRTGQRASNRWRRTRTRLSRLQHHVAEQRAAALHQITKDLATRFAEIAIEDLNVSGMTRTAKGTAAEPGRNVRAKSGLNRAVLDAAPGEFRRQLEYKTSWYGSTVAYADRWAPTSKTCSACGVVKTKLRLAERVFTCDGCGHTLDRDINAAVNIAAMAVAPDRGDTLNARGADVSPTTASGGGQSVSKREDPPRGSPRDS